MFPYHRLATRWPQFHNLMKITPFLLKKTIFAILVIFKNDIPHHRSSYRVQMESLSHQGSWQFITKPSISLQYYLMTSNSLQFYLFLSILNYSVAYLGANTYLDYNIKLTQSLTSLALLSLSSLTASEGILEGKWRKITKWKKHVMWEITMNKKYVMWGIKLENLLSPIDLSYLELLCSSWPAYIDY